MTKPEHRCPTCGDPDCSKPSPATLGVPNWLLAFAVIVAAIIADLVYTYTVR